MRRTLPALLALLLAPSLGGAQVRPPDARPLPAGERPADLQRGQACQLSSEEGLTLEFESCPAPSAGNAAREIEVVEYRNGDARVGAVRVSVGGVVRRDVTARHLSWSDPDDDGDGVPTVRAGAVQPDAARRAMGRVKVGRVTLERAQAPGADPAALPWDAGDLDGDGFPVTIDLVDPDGGTTTISFERCRPDSTTRGDADPVTLACQGARMVAALDANPYARLVAGAASSPAAALSLLDRRTPTPGAAGERARAPMPARTFRLEGARLEGWSIDVAAANDTVSWTLEVRVERIEMA